MAAFEEDEEFPEVSEEEKMAIASQFLLSSPPGEIREVLKDVKTLCGDSAASVLSDEVVDGVFRRYNNESAQVIGNVICDEATEVDGAAGLYLDAAAQRVIKVDPVQHTVVDADSADAEAPSMPSEALERREAVEAALAEYIGQQYVKDTTTVNVVCTNGGDSLVVLITGEKLNLKNYWTGRWRSRFVVDLQTKRMSGFVKILIHYFEDGNVQMNTDRSVDGLTLSFKDAESLGAAVRDEVAAVESKVQDSLEEMYVNMSNETFKDMRRVLPITRTKMDWSGAQLQLAKGFTKN